MAVGGRSSLGSADGGDNLRGETDVSERRPYPRCG